MSLPVQILQFPQLRSVDMQQTRFKPHACDGSALATPSRTVTLGVVQAGDVEVTMADGSHHSHQDWPRGPIERIPWRMPPAA